MSESTDYSGIPSYTDVRAKANIPPQRKMADLEGRDIVLLEWTPQRAATPDGKITDGFEATFRDMETDELATVFIGGVVLVRELRAFEPPFRTRIVKSGQAWRFS